MHVLSYSLTSGVLWTLLCCCGRVNYNPVEREPIDAALQEVDAATLPACLPISLTEGVFAHYDFETGGMADRAGSHDGTMEVGTPPIESGPCGNGVTLGVNSFGRIPNSLDWELGVGSVDLWVRPPTPPVIGTHGGIVSRDASGTSLPGHFLIGYTSTGRIVARVQAPGADGVACSNTNMPLGEWVHIGVNFGPPTLELYIDGVLQAGTGEESMFTTLLTCASSSPNGIVGNANPWSVGVSLSRSVEGTGAPISDPFEGGIDELRISSAHRSFGVLATGQ